MTELNSEVIYLFENKETSIYLWLIWNFLMENWFFCTIYSNYDSLSSNSSNILPISLPTQIHILSTSLIRKQISI